MTVELTASHDACQASAYAASNGTALWLQARFPKRQHSLSHHQTLLRLTASIGVSVILTFATASSAKAPASLFQENGGDIETVDDTFTAARIALRGGMALAELTARAVSIEPASVHLVKEPDPLQSIAPPTPAENDGLQMQIIRSKAPNGIERTSSTDAVSRDGETCIQFEGRCVPRWLVDTITRAADKVGVDPVYMMALADKESSFIPTAKAGTSSATGLFQFISSTWLQAIREFGPAHGLTLQAGAIQPADGQLAIEDDAMREHILGLRKNAYIAALMAAEMTKRDRTLIESRLGRPITRSEFYFAHFFGVDSASRFMRLVDNKPKQSAPRVFPAAAKANRTLFFKKAGRKTRQLTLAEVYDKIDGMIDRKLDVYEDVTSLAREQERTVASDI
ncbi:transglycosylase SLT domain-containing protein [Microvirga flavescens]|uniref:transglycosylase SLT domain-containing protein n=1 Tax=Microvirga flavescens TaxID=2249811 RepID=UPI000DDAD11C|nr:transglycosylase SLT domain-containing protein [Microvirga flavescens]